MREDFIHYCIRKQLRDNDWLLIAGQYPNGSDDELPSLNIMDPVLACDNSPDHRRHSMNKLVPDLVAAKGNLILLVEMKPNYSIEDEEKLLEIVGSRKDDLLSALSSLVDKRNIKLAVPLDQLIFIPSLGLSYKSKIIKNNEFCYFRVRDLSTVLFEGNSSVESL